MDQGENYYLDTFVTRAPYPQANQYGPTERWSSPVQNSWRWRPPCRRGWNGGYQARPLPYPTPQYQNWRRFTPPSSASQANPYRLDRRWNVPVQDSQDAQGQSDPQTSFQSRWDLHAPREKNAPERLQSLSRFPESNFRYETEEIPASSFAQVNHSGLYSFSEQNVGLNVSNFSDNINFTNDDDLSLLETSDKDEPEGEDENDESDVNEPKEEDENDESDVDEPMQDEDGNESDKSDSGDDEVIYLGLQALDLEKEENVSSYIDGLMSTYYAKLKKYIETYNHLIMKFSKEGSFSNRGYRNYLHNRREINRICGIFKSDISFCPPQYLRPEQFLLESKTILDLNYQPRIAPDPSGAKPKFNSSGLPDVNMLPFLKDKKPMPKLSNKERKKSRRNKRGGRFSNKCKDSCEFLQKRLKTLETFNQTKAFFLKLHADPKTKVKVFGELAKAHQKTMGTGDYRMAQRLRYALGDLPQRANFNINSDKAHANTWQVTDWIKKTFNDTQKRKRRGLKRAAAREERMVERGKIRAWKKLMKGMRHEERMADIRKRKEMKMLMKGMM